MGKWDDIRKKFEEAAAKIQKDTARATQKRELVQAHGDEMWKELFEEARNAVAEVNTGREMLAFNAADPLMGQRAFTITSIFDNKQKEASAAYDPRTYAVSVRNGTNPSTLKLTLDVNNENKVVWASSSGGNRTAQAIVHEMLVGLLRGSA